MSTYTVGKVRPTSRGEYNNTTAYAFYDFVSYLGNSYICINNNGSPAGVLPTNTAYWSLFVKGLNIFNSVSNLRAASLGVGEFVTTKGYYTPNDGGNGNYIVRAKQSGETDNGGNIIVLNNGLVAELVFENKCVNVKQFGAKGDGTTDDSSAITTALGCMQDNGGILFFPPAVYKILHSVEAVFANAVSVKISGYGAKIDATDSSYTGNGTVFTLAGKRRESEVISLTSNVSKGSSSVTADSEISSDVSDIVLIHSSDLWCSNRDYYYKGEFGFISEKSGNSLTFSTPLYDNYTASTTVIYPLDMPTIVVEGLELEADNNGIGLALSYCRNSVVKDCTVHGARYTGIQISYCYGGSVKNCEVYDSWYSDTGTSYNIVVNSSFGVVVDNNILNEARHNIATGGQEPCRNLTISNNTCTVDKRNSSPQASIDNHENGEFINIINNFVNGSIGVSSLNVTISGNTIVEARSSDVSIGAVTYYCSNSDRVNPVLDISNNKILHTSSLYGCAGIRIQTTTNEPLTIDNINITNNYIRVAASGGYGVQIIGYQNQGILTINRLCCNSNDIEVTVAGLSLRPTMTSYTADMAVINNNKIKSGKYCLLCTATNLVLLSDNYLFSTNTSSIREYMNIISAKDVKISGCHFVGAENTQKTYGLSISGADRAVIQNSYFDGFYYSIGSGGPHNSEITCSNNYFVNCNYTELYDSGELEIPVSALYSNSNNRVRWATAIPTKESWKRGDVIYNSSPSAGGTVGWVCVSGGTPGTWKTFGTIAS